VILVDTSVWIDHIRAPNGNLVTLLGADNILVHPFVLGEVALGHTRSREAVMKQLRHLPQASIATEHEVLALIERRRLFGRGIGHVDTHLLASATITPNAALWTFDQRLEAAAVELGVVFQPSRRH
jgi:hypothetical protein